MAPLPSSKALAQAQTRNSPHQGQLGWPGVTELGPVEPDGAVGNYQMMRMELLVWQVVNARLERREDVHRRVGDEESFGIGRYVHDEDMADAPFRAQASVLADDFG